VVEEAAAGAGFSASAAGVVSVVSAVVRFAIGAVNEAMVYVLCCFSVVVRRGFKLCGQVS
jgi:hypothetical protein